MWPAHPRIRQWTRRPHEATHSYLHPSLIYPLTSTTGQVTSHSSCIRVSYLDVDTDIGGRCFPVVFLVPPDEARGSTLNRVTVMSRHTLSSSLVTCYPAIRRYIIHILTASLNKQYKYKLITTVTLTGGWPTNEYHWRLPWRRVALWDVSFGRKCCISFGAGGETARSSQRSGNFYRPTKHHIPEGFEFYVKHPLALMQNDTTDTVNTTFLTLCSINSSNMFPQLLVISRPSIIIIRTNTTAFYLLNNWDPKVCVDGIYFLHFEVCYLSFITRKGQNLRHTLYMAHHFIVGCNQLQAPWIRQVVVNFVKLNIIIVTVEKKRGRRKRRGVHSFLRLSVSFVQYLSVRLRGQRYKKLLTCWVNDGNEFIALITEFEFRNSHSGIPTFCSWNKRVWSLPMRPIGCPKTSVKLRQHAA